MTDPPICGFEFRQLTCDKRGDHECDPRWMKFFLFAAEMLTHVKGRLAKQPLNFDAWQIDDLCRPIFGRVVWSDDFEMYVRQYGIAWIETARKSGKSHFLAAVMLYLLVAEGEHAAEIYGAARTKDQAKIVYNVARMMVKNNDKLWDQKGGILTLVDYQKRIVYANTDSFYVCIAADDDSALGQDPQAAICDEIVAWRDRTLWDAVRTGFGSGARTQPLMIAATTPGVNLAGFAKQMHDQMVRNLLDRQRNSHIFVLLRNAPRTQEELEELQHAYPGHPDLPVSTDVFDERNWKWPNPGLGKSIMISEMRKQAQEAREDPEAENAFRVFKMAQWVAQTFRYFPMHVYDECNFDTWDTPTRAHELAGQVAYAALDLSARSDLTAWCLMIPTVDDGPIHVVWRFWMTQDSFDYLDRENNGAFKRWVEQGWIEVHPGSIIDYERVYTAITEDAGRYHIMALDADEWSFWPVIQRVNTALGLPESDVQAYKNTFDRMSGGMEGIKLLMKQGKFNHHGNPVARFCFECVEVRRAPYNPDLIRPEKPQRDSNPTRIDAVPVAAMAENARRRKVTNPPRSAYEDNELTVA